MDSRLSIAEYKALLFLVKNIWIYTQDDDKRTIELEESITKKLKNLRRQKII